MRLIDLTGRRFSRLKVVSRDNTKESRGTYWLCVCDCGSEVIAESQKLKSQKTKSCGCLKTERMANLNTKDYETDSPEYTAWINMKGRCLNSSRSDFDHYGGRGIKICPQWESFEVFLIDMGIRPSPKHSIDRIDVNGDYSPENCRWADVQTQRRNTRTQKNNLVGVRGVGPTANGKWRARLMIDGQMKTIGTFDKQADAINARTTAEHKHWS